MLEFGLGERVVRVFQGRRRRRRRGGRGESREKERWNWEKGDWGRYTQENQRLERRLRQDLQKIIQL